MESAFERLRRSRAEQDAISFVAEPAKIAVQPILKKVEVVIEQKDSKNCYSLSDAK